MSNSESIKINRHLNIPYSDLQFQSTRSGGPGGQHVNKVETAVRLRFDIPKSSLPEEIKELLISTGDKRISKKGILILKSQKSRSKEANKERVLRKLADFINGVVKVKKKRKKTKPTKASLLKRKKEKMSVSARKRQRKSPRVDLNE